MQSKHLSDSVSKATTIAAAKVSLLLVLDDDIVIRLPTPSDYLHHLITAFSFPNYVELKQ